ncbi:hypothetical protein ACPXCG_17305, partial [Gordonia sp. DT218]|uniref:hypothetical protein n=1 Tax=Gordonia sp. DT218 TaxID=3416659 RepID=UPI003CF703F4
SVNALLAIDVGGNLVFTRKIWVLLLAVVVVALSLFGAGRVAAEPQLPRIALASDNVGTLGDHDYCRGAFNVSLVAPKGKRGVVRVTLTSFGFTGNGSGWKRNPSCRFLAYLSFAGTSNLDGEVFVPVSFGPRRGERIVRDLHTGAGPAMVAVGTVAINNPIRVQQGYVSRFFTQVP